jgi:hypothetical protein
VQLLSALASLVYTFRAPGALEMISAASLRGLILAAARFLDMGPAPDL